MRVHSVGEQLFLLACCILNKTVDTTFFFKNPYNYSIVKQP